MGCGSPLTRPIMALSIWTTIGLARASVLDRHDTALDVSVC
jgi:hypothetical protein